MKFFIWDFDGTLYDTYPMILPAVMKVLVKNHVEAPERDVYRMLKEFSSKKVAETYDLDFAAFTEDLHTFENADQREPLPFEGMAETLAEIQAQGGRQFIMTHRMADDTKRLLALHGLEGYFEEIVGPERNFARKPDPEAINYLVDKYQMPSDRFFSILTKHGMKYGNKAKQFCLKALWMYWLVTLRELLLASLTMSNS